MNAVTFAAGVVLASAVLFLASAQGNVASAASTSPTGMRTAPGVMPIEGWECYPDVNGDGVISVADIGWLVYYFGQSVPPAPATTDLTGDGMVSVGDIGILVRLFGQPCWLD